MDGILVQDSDWCRKLSLSLYDLLKKKLLCDLGIVCSAQNDVTNIKSNEVVMVHRCVLSAASETIKHLSVSGQVYNLVKINGVNISVQCWDNVLEFVYCGHTTVEGSQLCDIRRAAQVLQIKALEREVDVHHLGYQLCVCPNKDPSVNSMALTTNTRFLIRSEKWTSELFEAMLDLLVKQTLCNMTIITEKSDKTSAEILAHLCMLVAASGTIRELVLQGSDTYNSVKIDSIAYNTWLYLLEYVYTSRVSIVKSNIPEVWVASQLLQIDGLANAVSPFANQIGTTRAESLPTQMAPVRTNTDKSTKTSEQSPLISDSESPAAVNDENSLGLSLNSDSCDTQSTPNPLDLPTSEPLANEQGVDEPTIDGNSVLEEIDSCNIKSELPSEMSAEISSLSSSVSGPQITNVAQAIIAGSQILHNAQLIPVHAGAGGMVQTSPQLVSGVGQWLQTMGLDGATPTMLWLPQGVIPVATSPQTPSQSLVTTESSKSPSPVKTASPSKGNTAVLDTSSTEGTSSAENTSKTPDKTCLYFCRKCERVFSQSSYLDKHKCSSVLQLKTVSSTRTPNVVTADPLSPTQVVSALQSEAVSSTRAVRNGTATNKLQCKFCLKTFSRTWTLNVHMRTHTGERPYTCTVCDKAFSDKSNMRQHMLIHTENKQYRCPNCQQAFAQKRYMKKHFVETCRRKVFAGDAAGDKEQQIEFNDENNLLASSQSVTAEQTQESLVIFVPKADTVGTNASKTVKSSAALVGGAHSKWDTSIIMAGDDVTMSRDEDTDSEHAHFESTEPEDPLLCGYCKRRFKTERQLRSHRCKAMV